MNITTTSTLNSQFDEQVRSVSATWLGLAIGTVMVSIVGLTVAVFARCSCFKQRKQYVDDVLRRILHLERLRYQSDGYPSTTPLPLAKNAKWNVFTLFVIRIIAAVYLVALLIGGIGISQTNETSWTWLMSNTAVVYFIYNSYWSLIVAVVYFVLSTGALALDHVILAANLPGIGGLSSARQHNTSLHRTHARDRFELLLWILLELTATAQLAISFAYWVAIGSVYVGIIDYPYKTSFIQGSAHGAGLLFVVLDMIIGSRRWCFSHILSILSYVIIWSFSSFFLYLGTGQVVYAVQDVTYVPSYIAYLFYPVFVLYYCVTFGIMYGIDHLINKFTSSITHQQTPN